MLPHSAPAPLSAVYKASTDVLTVTFDKLLRSLPTAAANWGGCLALVPRTAVQGLAPGDAFERTVTVPMFRGGVCFGADRCEYLAVPPDVISRAGIPAAAFAAFPCTVIP